MEFILYATCLEGSSFFSEYFTKDWWWHTTDQNSGFPTLCFTNSFQSDREGKAQDSFQALDRRLYILLLLNTSPAIQVSQDRASLSVKITMPCLQGQQREPHQQQHPSLELTCAELLPARPGGSLQDCLSGKRRKRKRCCFQRKEPGSYSPGYFKVLTLKSKHVSVLWVPFHKTLPQLSWPEHMQSS